MDKAGSKSQSASTSPSPGNIPGKLTAATAAPGREMLRETGPRHTPTFRLWELEELSLKARESPLLVGNQRDEHNVLGGQEGQVVGRSIIPTQPRKKGTKCIRQLQREPPVAPSTKEQGQEPRSQQHSCAAHHHPATPLPYRNLMGS